MGSAQQMLYGFGGASFSSGAAYSETWTMVCQSSGSNAGWPISTTTLSDKRWGPWNADCNLLYTFDTTNDQLFFSTPSTNALSRHQFETLVLNGATYSPQNVSAFQPYDAGPPDDCKWTWTNGTNGQTVNKLTGGGTNYSVVITAYVLPTTSYTITIGNTGAFYGYSRGAIGSIASEVGDSLQYCMYNSGTTTVYFRYAATSHKKYYGPTLKARYNGNLYTFTQSSTDLGVYTYSGDAFSMNANTGQTRAIEWISVGS